MKKIQKPFSITEAKRGARVETIKGLPVTILSYDYRIKEGHKAVVALIHDEELLTDQLQHYEIDGDGIVCLTKSLTLVIVKDVPDEDDATEAYNQLWEAYLNLGRTPGIMHELSLQQLKQLEAVYMEGLEECQNELKERRK